MQATTDSFNTQQHSTATAEVSPSQSAPHSDFRFLLGFSSLPFDFFFSDEEDDDESESEDELEDDDELFAFFFFFLLFWRLSIKATSFF